MESITQNKTILIEKKEEFQQLNLHELIFETSMLDESQKFSWTNIIWGTCIRLWASQDSRCPSTFG